MTYGGSVPAFTASYSGFVNGESATNLTTAPTCTATASSSSPVGGYPITCSGAASSGLPVSFSAGPASVCTAGGPTGATITLVGVGTCTVTAGQAGNGNYLPAPGVAQSFTVAYPALYLALGVTSSPAGPVTTGSVVTATATLANHTTASQTVTLKVTLAYKGSHGSLSITVPLTLSLSPGQTLNQSARFAIQSGFPRGTYTLSAVAADKGGDTASGSATLTVS